MFATWPRQELIARALRPLQVAAVLFTIATALTIGASNLPAVPPVYLLPGWWFTFDGVVLAEHLAALNANGTRAIFHVAQALDIARLATTGAALFLIAVQTGRAAPQGSLSRILGFAAAWLAVAYTVTDFLETLGLLVILHSPAQIAQIEAVAFSALAVTKVVFFVSTVAVLLVAMALRAAR